MKSTTPNTCKLKLHIPLGIINEVFTQLDKEYEISGVIRCNNKDQVTHVNTIKGESDSVYTANNVINFHTHPVSAYNGGDTVWGWPSGEDIRETLKFALNGNKAHLVCTVEGLYSIQVSPCKIKKMKTLLNDQERGILVFLIEEYFKCTHGFRCVKDVNKLRSGKGNIEINPYSFIDFANTFTINNMLKNEHRSHSKTEQIDIQNIGHTGINSHENNNINRYYSGTSGHCNKFPNTGFIDTQGAKIVTLPLKEYLSDLSELRALSCDGQESSSKCKKVKDLIHILENIIQKMNEVDCESNEWNSHKNAWFYINFFPSEYYTSGGYNSSKGYCTPSKMKCPSMKLNHEPFIRIFSNAKDGCTMNSIAKKNNFRFN